MVKQDPGLSTFVKVTNKDIYDKLLLLEQKLDDTVSKGRVARWMAGVALSISIGLGAIIAGASFS